MLYQLSYAHRSRVSLSRTAQLLHRDESDLLLLVASENSVGSQWVKKELSNALVNEIERRKVTVMPIKLDDAAMPDSIKDKLYADFRRSYDEGLNNLLKSIKARKVVEK